MEDKEKENIELLLIDGSALLHRAYHAYPKLTNRSGKLVNAVYGVASMIISALDEISPEYVTVAWDVPKPTFRHEKYIAYKANRPKTDQDLVDQIPMVREMLSAFGISQVEEIGYEADDLIGSIGEQFQDKVDQVVILTGDCDAMQLVGDKIGLLVPGRGSEGQKLYVPADVKEKYGVRVDQIVDYKALIGDPSDNIPGVLGVGPKTAEQLLQKFESLDGIYENLDKVKVEMSDRVFGLLEEGKDSAYLSRDLSEIKKDMKIDEKIEDFAYETLATDEAREFLEKMNFKSLVRRLFGEESVRRAQDKKNDKQMGMF